MPDLHAVEGTAALSLYSIGEAWQAQIVSYPLFGEVGAAEFPAYHLAYNAAIPLVVIVPGFLSFAASAALPGPARPTCRRGSRLSSRRPVSWPSRARCCGRSRCTTASTGSGRTLQPLDSLLHANGVRTAAITLGAGALVWSLLRRGARSA